MMGFMLTVVLGICVAGISAQGCGSGTGGPHSGESDDQSSGESHPLATSELRPFQNNRPVTGSAF